MPSAITGAIGLAATQTGIVSSTQSNPAALAASTQGNAAAIAQSSALANHQAGGQAVSENSRRIKERPNTRTEASFSAQKAPEEKKSSSRKSLAVA